MTTAASTVADAPSKAGSAFDNFVSSAAIGLQRTAQDWTDKLNDLADAATKGDALPKAADKGLHKLADTGSAKRAAAAEGLRATVRGRNVVTAAVKGSWSAGGPAVRAAIVTAFVAMVPLLLLSPVLLLVYLLSWLVIAAVMRASRSRKK